MPKPPKSLTICVIDNFSEGDRGFIDELRNLGHTVTPDMDDSYDIVFLGSITRQDLAWRAIQKFPNVPLVTYCWDFYKWAWEGKSPGYDWVKYAELLRQSHQILVPSSGQQLRLKELFDLPSTVVLASIPTYEAETEDKRFVLDPVRFYPEENGDWAVRACEELGIPVVHSEHQFTEGEFRNLVSTCSFMTCAYREASTGGLTLMEGLWNGKASLVSDSPYMGAKDYLGKFGYCFKYDDFNDLKAKIQHLWDNPPKVDKEAARTYMAKFTPKAFAKSLEQEFYDILS